MKTCNLQVIQRLFTRGGELLVTLLLLSGCSDESSERAAYDPRKPLVLESFSPHEGGVGTQLIIRGENFGYDASKIRVRIANNENREARVISAKGNRIYAIVPARADTGHVTVTIGEGDEMQEASFEEEFLYEFKSNLSTLCGGSRLEDVDGSFKEAQFSRPMRLALDDENSLLFVLESDNFKALRMVDLINQTVTTPWRGPGFNNVRTVSFGLTRDTLLIGVEGGSQNLSTIFLLRSDGFVRQKNYSVGSGSNASIVNPVDGELFVNNYYNGSVLRYDRESETSIELARPFKQNTDFSFCWSIDGKYLYALCIDNPGSHSAIMRMEYDFETKTLGEPAQWVGVDGQPGYQDGVGDETRINAPYQMCASRQGDYFLADTWNHCIRRIVDNKGQATVTTYAGVPNSPGYTEGDPLQAQLQFPTGIAISDDGTVLYVADKENNRIVKITVE